MSLTSINQAVVEMSQNQVVTTGKWKFQKSCVGPSVRVRRRLVIAIAIAIIVPATTVYVVFHSVR
jgi:hypothetical protein